MVQNAGPIQIKMMQSKPKQAFDFPQGFAGGMNTFTNADAISVNETPNVHNMELRNGVWCKRYGYMRYERVGFGPVRALHEFKQEGKPTKVIAIAGGKMFILEN